ncbi:hypothetical protein B0H19DRAFT_1271316 [Mycena capillaripes]|nr:hypothetical protein B0H19DRAFT_1271316 [Mycena capillaripes]
MASFQALDLSYAVCQACLFNLDVLEQILHHIALIDIFDTRGLKHARRSLLSISLTSRAWSESTLRLLWRRLDNPLPLVKLLTRFELGPGRQWHVDGTLTLEDWTRFNKHAAHVKELLFSFSVPLGDHTITLLANHQRPILPNLVMCLCPSWIESAWGMLLFGRRIVKESPDSDPVQPDPIPCLTYVILDRFSSTVPAEFNSLRYLQILTPNPRYDKPFPRRCAPCRAWSLSSSTSTLPDTPSCSVRSAVALPAHYVRAHLGFGVHGYAQRGKHTIAIFV